jgi:hypothetical protein
MIELQDFSCLFVACDFNNRYDNPMFGSPLKIDFHAEIELPPSAELACELTALQH